MSNCGYFENTGNRVICKHPEFGKEFTESLNRSGWKTHRCELCKSRCNGIYPSQLSSESRFNKNSIQ